MKKATRLGLALCAFLPASTFAAVANNKLTENGSDGSLADFLNRIKNYLLGFVGALAIFFIIYGGILMVTSSGDPKRLETAKKTLTYAIIGLLVVILAQTIYLLLTGTLANIFGSGTVTY